MDESRAGLLPLYVKLYDQTLPGLRERVGPFAEEAAEALRREGVAVTVAPVCCERKEVEAAIRRFREEDVHCIVTLHLAYSPSLEAAEALAGAGIPILFLDTTPDRSFGPGTDPERILYNHGIHGVQDLASVLRRRGVPYRVVAGHLSEREVSLRAAEMVRAARAARALSQMKVVRIGKPFPGMGDFQVPGKLLAERFGVRVEEREPGDLVPFAAAVTEEEIAEEVAQDRERFTCEVSEEVHRRTVRAGLGLRRLLEREGAGAFALNFLAFDSAQEPVSTVPFLECAKAMERGLGYAGEGDVLTASFAGAVARAWGRTTFTEMFCADWSGGRVFLSHMGEANPAFAAGRPILYEKDFPFTAASNPACLGFAFAPGPATFVNVTPGPDDSFRIIVAPVMVVEEERAHPEATRLIRAWIKPSVPVGPFLEEYSHLGGTHHSVLVSGDHVEGICAFAAMAGCEACVIAGDR